ncbi:hypothetical protein ASD67_09140 [Sphingopyxis sp. Root1497]|uniref:hypothetical protein n=1 Tax=Sphingopyxis sp. Root1497 TaxID=1736474 RepID=UPI00070212DC|nr:hypothetical protein [Sphingopyxis sp. Root1497]KQZ64609.1 hypothetical protein ASD67_09140 [Sphingopyxis sp. Root1497]
MKSGAILGAMGALALAAAPAAAQSLAKPPIPKSNQAQWVDIMGASQEMQDRLVGQRLVIAFTLAVGPHGRPTECTHEGEGALGAEFGALTCTQVMRRARFTPATDDVGNPVDGRWSGRAVWCYGDSCF